MYILSSVVIKGDLKVDGEIRKSSFPHIESYHQVPTTITKQHTFKIGELFSNTVGPDLMTLFDSDYVPIITAMDVDSQKFVYLDYQFIDTEYGDNRKMVRITRSDSSEEKTYKFTFYGIMPPN